jgi:diacylglycerol kinase family enzyme
VTSPGRVTAGTRPIPALLNPGSGSAARVLDVLQSDSRFRLRELDAVHIGDAVRAEALGGTPRLLVCGGDGTIAVALAAAAGTALEIAILPGGTLNHFARDFGLPHNDSAAALELAVTGHAKPVDLGYVNGHAILNTSSVGVYVDFVRRREHLESWLSYRLASVGAALNVWRSTRSVTIDLVTTDGKQRQLSTPLVFIGIQERVLDGWMLGARRYGGARALHILVVKEHSRLRSYALLLRAALHGMRGMLARRDVSTTLTSGVVVNVPSPRIEIAIDGELLNMSSPLRYEFVPGAVNVVCP